VITELLTGLGLVAVFEGLVLALAPLRFEDILTALSRMDVQTRRLIGLFSIAAGVAIVWIARFVIT